MMIELLQSDEDLWDLFTKKEEYDPHSLDEYQRFTYNASKHKNVLEPEVSAFLIENGLKIEYPDDKRFAICLSHDIDRLKPKILRGVRFGESSKNLFRKVSRTFRSIWNFSGIIELEEKFGAKSSFYFLALERHETDFDYNLDELSDELKTILDAGWEIGLHGGHKGYINLDELMKEKARLEKGLGKRVIGYRNHYLKFKVPTTWELLRKAGFEYDMTFGYSDHVGFRNGMCHPFLPFNLKTKELIDILEIPLIIMDGALDRNMKLDINESWIIVKRLIDRVEELNGVLSVLWHNTYMSGQWLDLYKRILSYCSDKDAWMTSGEEIWKWWDKNRFYERVFSR